MGMNSYQLETHPVCRPESAVQGEHYRITVLTPSLFRLEYSSSGVFEDRPTQAVLNRDFSVPAFHVKETREELSIYTEFLELHYNLSLIHI